MIKKHISDYLKKYSGDEEKIEKFSEFIEDFFAEADEDYAFVAAAFSEDLEDFTFELTDEMAEEIIECLKKRDGSVSGVKWVKSETDSVAKQNGIPEKMEEQGKHYCATKFWVAMNYVYAVHYNINRSTNGYIELALDELCNHNISFEDLMKKVSHKI